MNVIESIFMLMLVLLSEAERSEKDLVLLHLQCNSQKISDFLRSRSETRVAQLGCRSIYM